MCDRVGLLHEGRLVAEGDLNALREQSGEQRLSLIFLKLIGANESAGAVGS